MTIVTNKRPLVPCPSCGSPMKLVRIAAAAGYPPDAVVFVCLYCNELKEAPVYAVSDAVGASQLDSVKSAS